MSKKVYVVNRGPWLSMEEKTEVSRIDSWVQFSDGTSARPHRVYGDAKAGYDKLVESYWNEIGRMDERLKRVKDEFNIKTD